VIAAILWYQRLHIDQDRVTVFNGVPNATPSTLGDGIVIAGIGLAVGVFALLVAVPAMRRVWLS
jgi:hypothetical protein